MAGAPVTDDLARELRAAWFRYLDALEPLRPGLHRYCLRLTGNVWDAEDLVQDALLRGFGALGRGDLHGDTSRVANPRAYLLRIASNLWIDARRRAARDPSLVAHAEVVAEADAGAAREAAEALFERAAPQQRAAIVLKDVFDFTLEEIAELLSTSVGAVKSALHRGRERLKEPPMRKSSFARGPSRALVDRFVDAFNARDVERVTGVLLETVSIEVQGVGGGRGRDGNWATSSLADEGIRAEAREFQGEWIVLRLRGAASRPELDGVLRFEQVDDRISRIRSYYFCPETLAAVAAELGLATNARRYHQPPEILERMIATTALPWAQH